MKFFRQRLGARLFFSYLFIILVGALVMILTAEAALPRSFNRHMLGMQMTPIPSAVGGPAMGPGMGRMMGQGAQQELFANFRAGFTEAMLLAALAATLVALGVSLAFSRGIVAPLRQMAAASQRIASGHYKERVTIKGEDELARLGERFNQMAADLEQAEDLRRRLIGDVSHELRTPLTAIKGYMEGLVDGVLPATPETFQQIHTEADRLSRLVDDLQELSRVESGAYALDLRPAALPALVETTAKRLGPQFERKSITLSLSLPADLPPVLADSDRITQVLTNLVGNALQYTPPGGQVTVSAALAGREARISIADTGIGIPGEHLRHIFDRFYRVDKSRSRQAGGGSGIGLTIARAIVEAHGGVLQAHSAGPGAGSVFTFTLPLATLQSA
jgi:histidine kinase